MRQEQPDSTAINIFISLMKIASICAVVTFVFSSKIQSLQTDGVHEADSLQIQFGHFSPAYAAFEDGFLFEDEVTKTVVLAAGTSQSSYANLSGESAVYTPRHIHVLPFLMHAPTPGDDSFYDDEIQTAQRAAEHQQNFPDGAPSQHLKLGSSASLNNGVASGDIEGATIPKFVLSIGPVVASVAPKAGTTTAPYVPAGHPGNSLPFARASQDPNVGEHSLTVAPDRDGYLLGGDLQLIGGLAFLGSMEVSWIVDGEKVGRGQIALDEGRYDIETEALTGHIVISLYDENDFLIGEGSANLEELSEESGFDPGNISIQVKDINASLAGKIKSVYSIGANEDPIEGAEVSLFGIDASTESNAKGEYHFNEWKYSDSKTLAQASKDGYKDSIFLIDSNTSQDVIMLSNSYALAFFNRLQNLGYGESLDTAGTVYGTLSRDYGNSMGLRAEIEGAETVYLQSYFAMREQISTDASGLFAIVGLPDGDHVLRIFDGDQLVDRRILAVEHGKVSPIEISLKTQKKILKFVDPLFDDPIPIAATRFFDGEYDQVENTKRVKRRMTRGADPALLEYAFEGGQENMVFVSRNDRHQQLPVINKTWLAGLRKTYDLKPELGVAFGFMETDAQFRIVVAEKNPERTLYFDKQGKVLEAPGPGMAGFILLGLDEGLHTLMIESPSGDELYFTDLMYNNHESHSVVLHEL